MDITGVLFLLLVSAVPYILAYNVYRRERAGVTRVPIELIDNKTTHLYLRYNLLTVIDEDTFLGFDQLANIYLTSNRITVIADSAFNGTTLSYLLIDSNRLTTLPKLGAVGSTLQTLYAGNNQIEQLEDEVFSGLIRLTSLDISNNHIARLGDGVFNELTRLTTLNLQNNQITSIAPNVLTGISPPLSTLYISNNRLSDIDFLGPPNLSYDNRISLLYMDGNYMDELPTNAFERLVSVTQLRMVATGLTEIPDLINQRRTLIYLYLSWNFITVIRKDAFDGFNLVRLELDNNRLVDVSYLFHPLISITTLYLNDNNIGPIDISHINRPITDLTSLYLQNNNLGAMPCGDMMRLLELLPRLTTLYLQSTGLETFPDISMLNHRLTRLYLLNPRSMRCDCSLEWMRNITQIVTYTDITLTSRPCGSPSRLVGIIWSQVTEEDLCQGEDITSCGRYNRTLPHTTHSTEQTMSPAGHSTPSTDQSSTTTELIMSPARHSTPSTEQSSPPTELIMSPDRHSTPSTEQSTQPPISQSDFPWIAVIAGVLGLLLFAMIVAVIVLLVRRKSPASQVKAVEMQEDKSSPGDRPGYTELERRPPSSTYEEIPHIRNN